MTVVRVHGGAFLSSQTLAGSLRYFEITGGVGSEFEYTLGGYPSGAVAAPANYEQRVNSGTIVSGGAGYSSGDVLTVVGGTAIGGAAGTFTVGAVNGSGAVTRITQLVVGKYEIAPANPVATTTGGGGSNCTLNLEFTGVVVALGTNTYIGAAAPVPESTTEQVCEVIMQNATIVQIALVPSLTGDVIQIAVESESMAWDINNDGNAAAEMQVAIRAMGTITVPYLTSVGDTFDMSGATVTEIFLSQGFNV